MDFRLELFHVIADPDCAAVRRQIVEWGLKAQIDFRNIDTSESAKADLARLSAGAGPRTGAPVGLASAVPALRAGDELYVGKDTILKFLSLRRAK